MVKLDRISTRVATMACPQTEEPVFHLVRQNVDDIVLVSDDDMLEAARWLWFELGIAADEAGRLIEELRDHATHERFVYHHAWRVGDVLMWDEIATMHRGAGDSALEHRPSTGPGSAWGRRSTRRRRRPILAW